MLEDYEKMGDADKQRFKELLNRLLEHCYVFKYEYDDRNMKQDDGFYFAKRNIEVIKEYLSIIGYDVDIDDNYGICYISSFPSSARGRFDKFTTLLVYTLRHLYEEGRQDAMAVNVRITVGRLVDEYMDLSGISKKPSNKDIASALRNLVRANVVSKGKGGLDEDTTELLILPSILLILPDENVLALEASLLSTDEEASDIDDENGEDA